MVSHAVQHAESLLGTPKRDWCVCLCIRGGWIPSLKEQNSFLGHSSKWLSWQHIHFRMSWLLLCTNKIPCICLMLLWCLCLHLALARKGARWKGLEFCLRTVTLCDPNLCCFSLLFFGSHRENEKYQQVWGREPCSLHCGIQLSLLVPNGKG